VTCFRCIPKIVCKTAQPYMLMAISDAAILQCLIESQKGLMGWHTDLYLSPIVSFSAMISEYGGRDDTIEAVLEHDRQTFFSSWIQSLHMNNSFYMQSPLDIILVAPSHCNVTSPLAASLIDQ
jgi:hypothetical protein